MPALRVGVGRQVEDVARTRDLPAVDVLADRLAAGAPPQDDTVLVHGDCHLDNVVIGGDGTVAAVLDWELWSRGHPLADVGLAVAYWDEAGTRNGMFGQAVTTAPGFPTADAIVEAYASASGRDVSDLPYFIAFAYWKIAVIAEGAYRRWPENPVNGAENVGELVAAVPNLVEQAVEAARAARL